MQEMLEALGSLLSVNTQYGQLPDSPDNIILLNFSGGNTPRRSFGIRKPTIKEPSIQLMVRQTSYLSAAYEINRCADILLEVIGDYGGKTITKISQLSDVLHLGRDEKNRYMFSVNFVVQLDNAKEE